MCKKSHLLALSYIEIVFFVFGSRLLRDEEKTFILFLRLRTTFWFHFN